MVVKTAHTSVTFAAVFGSSVGVRLTGATELMDSLRGKLVIILRLVDERVSGVNLGG